MGERSLEISFSAPFSAFVCLSGHSHVQRYSVTTGLSRAFVAMNFSILQSNPPPASTNIPLSSSPPIPFLALFPQRGFHS